MNENDVYMFGCLHAVRSLVENGSQGYSIKVNGEWRTVTWSEVKEWLEKRYVLEPKQTEQ